ncbi:MAG TPA: fused MFS/spermidine synthase [Candidatus Omnitrophota bacterium]|nr:fused MFS/spermidine synthase [Candidatus Omnitrophota bacterium]HQO57664.1 fused MFS/spermidine synthase [Candidatus Omnitrophota bacterium]
MRKIYLLKAALFLASFLLFQIELIIGKMIMPYYGGGYLVWGACVVFFQVVLLAGYSYMHVILRAVDLKRYLYAHLALFVLPLFFFPGRDIGLSAGLTSWPLVLGIFWQLFWSIGLVFFLLSTSSVFFQAWLSQSSLAERDDPYQLFATSNWGSFAGLLTYPVFFEYFFTLPQQQAWWRGFYLLFLGLLLVAARQVPVTAVYEQDLKEGDRGAGPRRTWGWFLYGAAGVMLLLSVTNILTSEILPIPLLWILPLALYLLSFALVFKKRPWRPAWITHRPFGMIGVSALLYFTYTLMVLPVLFELGAFLAVLFYLCMFIQGQVYDIRPPGSRQLSYYYFIFSLGGFCGGMVVTWMVPVVSVSFVEYLLGIYVTLLAWQVAREKSLFRISHAALAALTAIILYILFPQGGWVEWLVVAGVFQVLLEEAFYSFKIYKVAGVLFLSFFALLEPLAGGQYVYKGRNYYGISRIYDKSSGFRFFMHGSTIHGVRYLDNRAHIPLAYYAPNSPVGRVLQSPEFHFDDIASLGLGVGSVMSYFRAGQRVDSYELDPEIIRLARTYFSFLSGSGAEIRHIVGDARIELRDSGGKQYDCMIIDTFSGDSVPVHLMTLEALQEYRAHLKPEGVLLFHLSNHFADIRRIVAAEAVSLGARVAFQEGQREGEGTFFSKWAAVTWDEACFRKLTEVLPWRPVSFQSVDPVRPWTDQYSNFLPVLKFQRKNWAE